MGQRTQILVNIEVVDDNGIRSVERELVHYQWGGYSNIMFLSLKNFFTNVKLFLGGIETKDIIFTEKKNKEYNMLRNNLINVLKNPYCTFEINEIMPDEKILEIKKAEKTGFFLETFNYADYENGAIFVDLFVNLQTNEKYCKWAFLNYETYETDISENFIELEELKTIWKLNSKNFKKITNIVKNINKEELLVNAGNGNVKDFKIEYDKEHISEIFKYPY
jgi:hypothetical protein